MPNMWLGKRQRFLFPKWGCKDRVIQRPNCIANYSHSPKYVICNRLFARLEIEVQITPKFVVFI